MSKAVTADWCDCGGGAPIESERFEWLADRLDQALARLVAVAPLFAPMLAQVVFGIDGDVQANGRLGYATVLDEEGNQPAIAVSAAAAETLELQQLEFVLAHELTHIRLGHQQTSLERPNTLPEVAQRLLKRATEPLVNDHVYQAGVVAPDGLAAVLTISGEQAFGFNSCGLVRREIWEFLVGRRSRAELVAMAAMRGGDVVADRGWTEEVLSPPPEACTFWQKRLGFWQPDWSAPHGRLS